MRFVQMETTTFLVREKGLDPEAFGVQATRLVCRGHIREQMERFFLPFGPATQEHHRAIGGCRYAHIGERDQRPWCDTGGHRLAPEVLPIPQDRDVASRPDHVGPAIGLHGVLERGAIELAIAQQDDLCLRREDLVHLLAQHNMEVFREMPLLALAHQPREGQRSSFIHYMDHQGDTPTPHHAPIHHQDERLQRQRRQQDLSEGEKIDLGGDVVVPQPSGKAFDPTFWLGPIRHMGSDGRQLGALARYDAADQRGQGDDVSGDSAPGFSRVPLCQSIPYGTILAEVVTHRMLLPMSISQRRVYDGATS